ncbi:MAG TPA: hypothetical protein VHS31_16515 [Tepidisphaeraceae bacterium]|jgi:hypothetical protein|nr:hypothetical protein [Tepidisphaeraceae bacterium]
MEEFIKSLINFMGPTISAYLGAGVVVLFLVPSILNAWQTWLDARSGARAARAERARLELLKLWFEIEVLKKEHDLQLPFPVQPPLAATVAPSPQSHADAIHAQIDVATAVAKRQPRMWQWVSALDQLHRFASIMVLGLLGAITLFLVMLGLMMVIGSLATLTRATSDIAAAVISTALELLFLWMFRAIYFQFNLLRVAPRLRA